jgi:hypothetical protein
MADDAVIEGLKQEKEKETGMSESEKIKIRDSISGEIDQLMKRHRMEIEAMRAGFDREREELGRAMRTEVERVKKEAAHAVEEAMRARVPGGGVGGNGGHRGGGGGGGGGGARVQKHSTVESADQREVERRDRLEREVENLKRAIMEMSADGEGLPGVGGGDREHSMAKKRGKNLQRQEGSDEGEESEGDWQGGAGHDGVAARRNGGPPPKGKAPSARGESARGTPVKGAAAGRARAGGSSGGEAALDRLRETQEEVMRQLREARERGGKYAAASLGGYRPRGAEHGMRVQDSRTLVGDAASPLDASSMLDSYLKAGL